MHALIIANGALPDERRVRALVSAADVLICADGGANAARRLGLKPDVILGDFDSIEEETRNHFRTVPQHCLADQESTDLEKALTYALERKARSIDILGASGDRLDHTTGSLGCFRKFGHRSVLRIVDTVGTVELIANEVTFAATPGERVSLIPLGRCSGVTTTNLRYPLRDDVLELGLREGISNEATAATVTVKVASGTLLLYRFHR
jgi:thiamine pyrophosphokinase